MGVYDEFCIVAVLRQNTSDEHILYIPSSCELLLEPGLVETAIYWSGQVMITVRVTTKDECNTLICKACLPRLSGKIQNLKK